MEKIKWFFTEIINIYSTKKSYFSKKRIESGIAFVIAQWGMIFFLLEKHIDLSMGEFLLWAAAEFAVAGWMIHKIQKEKSDNTPS
jgi:ribose/xylose/arabinose/galactoside ABC-type transport system permease subunit